MKKPQIHSRKQRQEEKKKHFRQCEKQSPLTKLMGTGASHNFHMLEKNYNPVFYHFTFLKRQNVPSSLLSPPELLKDEGAINTRLSSLI